MPSPPTITITQGASVTTGTPNLDTLTGLAVTFSTVEAFGTYQWQLISRPVNHSLVESTDALVPPTTNPTVVITPTMKGTYKVRFIADGGVGMNKISELWFYARNPLDPLIAPTATFPRRHFAYTEGAETGSRGAMTELDAWLYIIEDLSTTLTTGVVDGNYNCPITVIINDVVYLSSSDTVDKADADDGSKQPVIGFVVSKPTTTTAIVRYYGELAGFGGLITGSTYYLSITPGLITATAPTIPPVIVQRVGFAKSATTLMIMIDRDFTVLT